MQFEAPPFRMAMAVSDGDSESMAQTLASRSHRARLYNEPTNEINNALSAPVRNKTDDILARRSERRQPRSARDFLRRQGEFYDASRGIQRGRQGAPACREGIDAKGGFSAEYYITIARPHAPLRRRPQGLARKARSPGRRACAHAVFPELRRVLR